MNPRAPAPATKPPRVSVGVPNWAKSDVDILLSLVGELLPLTQQQWQRLAQIYNKHPDRLHERDWEAVKRKFNKLRSTGRANDPDCPEDARWARELQHEIEVKGDKNYHEDDDAGSSRGDSSMRDDDDAAVDHVHERREMLSDADAQSIARVVHPASEHDEPSELPRTSRVAVREPSERSFVEPVRRVRKRAYDESVAASASDTDGTPFKRPSPAIDAETLQRGGLSTELVTLLMLMDERSQLRMEQREEREDARRREREEREEARRLAMEERYLMEQRIRDEQRRKDEMRHERTERLQMLLFSKLLGVDVSKLNEDPPTN